MKTFLISNLKNSSQYQAQAESLELLTWQPFFGGEERWVDFDHASTWEKSREIDRRSVESSPAVPAHEVPVIDSHGNPTGELSYIFEVPATFKTQIKVPDDFAVEDITESDVERKDFAQTQIRERLCRDVITYVGTYIGPKKRNFTKEQKLTAMARPDIKAILELLNYGSLDDSERLMQAAMTDSIVDAQMKTDLLNFIHKKQDEFTSLVG